MILYGGLSKIVNDIKILQEMLVSDAQVRLQQERDKPPFVKLKDKQSKGTVEITGLPHNSIVIRAEDFEDSLAVFKGSKGERKRADFVIISNQERGKWIICIEIEGSRDKGGAEVVEQLKGALCFVNYCKCVGKEFWLEQEFLDGYKYRFVHMVHINLEKRKTRSYSPHIQSKGKLHDTPDAFLRFLWSPYLHFSRLLHEVP